MFPPVRLTDVGAVSIPRIGGFRTAYSLAQDARYGKRGYNVLQRA